MQILYNIQARIKLHLTDFFCLITMYNVSAKSLILFLTILNLTSYNLFV